MKDIYRSYDFFLKLLGYEHQMGRFIYNLNIEAPENCNILDIGCGTGIAGLNLSKKFKSPKLLATDIKKDFLDKIDKKNIKNIFTAFSDISKPESIMSEGRSYKLKEDSFDIISACGVLGYSKDPKQTLSKLTKLIKDKGYLINLELNNSPLGKIIAKKYKYSIPSLKNLKISLQKKGFNISIIRLSPEYFPVNLTRTAIIARKK